LKTHKKNSCGRIIVPLLGVLLLIWSCRREPAAVPQLSVSGYKAELLFQDTFNRDLSHWRLEGRGTAQITESGTLKIDEFPESQGVALWIDQNVSDPFLLEYEVNLPDTNGMNLIFICAQNLDGGNVLADSDERTGALPEYSLGKIKSYQISYHSYTPEGTHENSSRLRKNPGSLLLMRSNQDPCRENRYYHLDVVKTGTRIQFLVDKVIVHDLRDRGGFGGPAYNEGRIGFWFHGEPGHFTTFLDNVRIFKLTPR